MGSQGQGLYNEAQTLALGNDFHAFQSIEGDPHNLVHSSFGGFLSDPTIAPRDPLFFLLHANVDRLWAKWQWLWTLYDPGNPDAYAHPNPPRIGHDLNDTMWPWNGITGNGQQPTPTGNNRPPTAPGGALPQSADLTFPPSSPMVRDMLDYQGIVTLTDRMGFDYDDVPFEA
jgi:tyrosinase